VIPPADICRRLAKLHPQLRIAFNGQQGTYSLIQLYHRRDFQRTARGVWNHQGPIYSKKGEWRADWSDDRFPIYVGDVSMPDVHGGRILGLVKEWARPHAQRIRENRLARNAEVEKTFREVGEEAGAKLYRDGQRNTEGGTPILARKFHTETPNLKKYREGKLDFTEYGMPSPPPGGWEKAAKADFVPAAVDEVLPAGR